MATKRCILILLWLAINVSIFAWTMMSYQAQDDPQLKYEILMRHAVLMLLITFPSGWLLVALVGVIALLAGIDLLGEVDAFLVSLVCAALAVVRFVAMAVAEVESQRERRLVMDL